MSKRQLLYVLVSLFFSTICSLNAQRSNADASQAPSIGKLMGVVKDKESGKPIEYATITLISKRDSSLITGGVTDKNGRFTISEIQLGFYQVKIKFIGYDAYETSVKLSPRSEGGIEQNLGVIALQISAQMLDEAQVVAERDVMVSEIDRKVFNVAQNLTAQGGTADEILVNIPSVDVDADGNVSLRGSENVTILINGKPSGLAGAGRQAVLDQIPASSIERVEIITNPSAKFDPDGMAGIINIVLKKNREAGINGSVNLGIGTAETYNAAAQLSYNSGKWNVFGNYGFNYRDAFSNGTNLRQNIFENELNIIDQISSGSRQRENHLVKGGLDFYANERNTLSLAVTHRFGDQSRLNTILYQDGISLTNLSPTSERQSPEIEDEKNTDINFTYRKDFEKPQQNFTLDYVFSDSYELETGIYEEIFFDEFTPTILQNNFTKENAQIHTLSADYVHPIGKNTKLETGYKLIHRRINTDFDSETFDYTLNFYAPDIALNNEFEYSEEIHAVYGIFGQTLGNFAYQVGLRAESALTDSRLITTNELFENDYISLFPNAYIKYNLDKTQQVQLSYGRRINRPRTGQLNPFTDYGDPFNLRSGNPFLKPEYIDVYELNYAYDGNKHSVNFGLYYRDITNVIRRFKTVNDTTSVAYTTFVNLEGGRTYGAELIWNFRPAKIFSMMFSTNVFRNELDASNLESDLSTSGTSFSSKLMANLNPAKNISLQISSRYRAPFIITQGMIWDFYATDIAIRQKIWKGKADFSFRITDIFNNMRFRLEIEADNFTQDSYRKWESRTALLNFSYRFGKQTRKRGKKGDGAERGGGGGGGDMDF